MAMASDEDYRAEQGQHGCQVVQTLVDDEADFAINALGDGKPLHWCRSLYDVAVIRYTATLTTKLAAALSSH